MIDLNLNDLEGKWFILYSDFPMWTSGKRKYPSLNYTLIEKNSKFCIEDKVKYEAGGKSRSIDGFDQYLGNGEFMWKGKGILSILRSRWKVIVMEKDWMLIYFEKTLFTPSGYDLISRNPSQQDKFTIELKNRNLDLKKIEQK
jgi:hypothetical protein